MALKSQQKTAVSGDECMGQLNGILEWHGQVSCLKCRHLQLRAGTRSKAYCDHNV